MLSVNKTVKMVMAAGLSVVASLMISGASFAGGMDEPVDDGGVTIEPWLGDPAVDVVPVDVQYWHDINPGCDPCDEGIAVGEPDPNGGDDGWVDDGSDNGDDGWVDDGSDGGDDGWVDDGGDGGDDGWVDDGSGAGGTDPVAVDDPSVTIYTMDGGPVLADGCGGCEMQSGAGPEVQRSVTHRSSGHSVFAHGPNLCNTHDPLVAMLCGTEPVSGQ